MTDRQLSRARDLAYKYNLRTGDVIDQVESLAEDPETRMTIDMALRFLEWAYAQDQVGV